MSAPQLAVEVYKHQCALHKVKANAQILAQLNVGPLLTPTISRIDCSMTFLGTNGARAVLGLVDTHQTVEELDLSGNSIDGDAVIQLKDVAERHNSLRELSLKGNKLSTPAARVIWELVKGCDRIINIDLTDTGLAEEWTNRIERQLEQNRQYQKLGFLPFGPQRPVFEWATAFVGIIGDQQQARRFNDEVIPVINSLFAKDRTRVATIVFVDGDEEDVELLEGKLAQCQDRFNYSMPWILGFFPDGSVSAVAEAVINRVVYNSKREAPPPLKNKLGELREPLHICAQNVFLYFSVSDVDKKDALDYSPEEKRTAALQKQLFASPNAQCMKTDDPQSIDLKAMTSIFVALQTTYLVDEPSKAFSETDDTVAAKMWNFCARSSHMGREQETSALVQFVNRVASPTAFPMVAYGASGMGRAFTLARLCCALQEQINSGASAQSDDAKPQIVVPYVVGEAPSRSIIYFLWYVLDALGYKGSKAAPTLETLMELVKNAIANYDPTAPRLCLVVVNLELLTTTSSRGIPSQDWLPHSLPPNIRVVLSVATDCPALVALRKRSPQPYEMLLSAVPAHERMQKVVDVLNAQGTPVPGFNAEAASSEAIHAEQGVVTDVKDPVHALLLKEESDLTIYIRLLPPFFKACGAHLLQTTEDVKQFVAEQVPDTCENIVPHIITDVAKRYGMEDVSKILMIITACPVSIPQTALIAEKYMEVKQFKAVPILVALRSAELIDFAANGLVKFSHPKVARGVAAFCGPAAIDTSVGILAHHHQLELMKRSEAMALAFHSLPDLLLRSGQDEILRDILIDAQLLDDLMQISGMRVFVIDALFRLLHHYELLEELDTCAAPHFRHDAHKGFLMQAIADMTTCPTNVYQRSLLNADQNLHFKSAITNTCHYPVLIPTNKYCVEQSSVGSVKVDSAVRHCFCANDAFVTTQVNGTVTVYNLEGVELARGDAFSQQDIVGAIMTGEDVVCIADEQLVIWNYITNTRTALDRSTCSLSTACMNKDKNLLAVVNVDTFAVSLLHIARRKTLSTLPSRNLVREVKYAGENILVVSLYDIFITPANEGECIALEHSGLVHAATSTIDGKIIASAVGNNVWVWSSDGDCMHIASPHASTVNDVTFHPNGSLLASSDRSGTIVLTMSLSGQPLITLHTNCGYDAAYTVFSSDGMKMISRCGNVLRMWDGTTFEDLGAVAAHNGDITHAAVAPTSPLMITVSNGGETKRWSTHHIFPGIDQFAGNEVITDNIAISPKISRHSTEDAMLNDDRTFCAVLSELAPTERQVSIWPLAGGPPAVVINGAEGVAFNDNETFFIIQNRKISLMRIADQEVLWSINLSADIDDNSSWKIAFDAETHVLVAISMSQLSIRINCYNTQTQKRLVQFLGHFKPVCDVFIANDCVYTVSEDRTMRVWSLAACAERSDYKHNAAVTAGCRFGKSDCVLCDENGAIVRIAVKGSTLHAEEFATLPFVVKACRQIAPNLLALIHAEDGSIHIFDTDALAIVNAIKDRHYTSLRLAESSLKRFASVVVVGSKNGHVVVMDLRLPGTV